jgi:hypothetical protein
MICLAVPKCKPCDIQPDVSLAAIPCSECNVPMEVPAEHLEEAMLHNPMIADYLDQAKANGRDDIFKARVLLSERCSLR